jgi:hypothetical protein
VPERITLKKLRRASPRWANRSFAEKKLIIPILALGAEKSFSDQQTAILCEVGTNVEGGIVTGSGH